MKNKILILSLIFNLTACVTNQELDKQPPKEEKAEQDQTAVRKEVSSHQKEFKSCFDVFHKVHPDLYGKMVVAFQISEKGEVSNAEVDDRTSTLKDTELHSCILNKVKVMRLPAAPKGSYMTVRYPIQFQAAP